MRAPTHATPDGNTPARIVQKPSRKDSGLLVLQSSSSARLLYLKTPKNWRAEFRDSPWISGWLAILDLEAMGRREAYANPPTPGVGGDDLQREDVGFLPQGGTTFAPVREEWKQTGLHVRKGFRACFDVHRHDLEEGGRLSWNPRPVVTDDLVAEEHVFLARAGADVVDDERRAGRRLPVAHDADVQDAAAEIPGHDIAR